MSQFVAMRVRIPRMNSAPVLTHTVTPRSDRVSLPVPPSFVGKQFVVSFHLVAPEEPVPPAATPPARVPDIPESLRKRLPKFTKEQIEALGSSPRLKAFSGILKGTGLPPDITMKDVRAMRLNEKYGL